MCGRLFLLADLGADVIGEPPAALVGALAPACARGEPPLATHNAGKRGVVIDHTTSEGRERLAVLDRADVRSQDRQAGRHVGGSGFRRRSRSRPKPRPGRALDHRLRAARPIPRVATASTDWTLLAIGHVLSRSGLPGREPLMPPGDLALQVTAVQSGVGSARGVLGPGSRTRARRSHGQAAAVRGHGAGGRPRR